MKMLTLFVFLFGVCSHSFCQTTIESFPISVCVVKTTNIIFPSSIKSVDRGSKDVIVQKAKGLENILQVKAARQNFISTNLSVITADGKLYSFLVSYSNDPTLNLNFANDLSTHENDTQKILSQKHFLHRRVHAEKMKINLTGIYLFHQMMWFCFEIKNNSLLDYHSDDMRFFLQDRKKAARSAIQETEIPVIYPEAFLPTVPGKKNKQFALAFAPFTFSKDKKMIMEMSEKNGGRLLSLSLTHKIILRAKQLK
ncbi:MAG TPA: conjugative transposon protein TraN [Puia sp.]|jgi:conjugative transposon TraN protein|nr:conjugative transposon protein TraN [Puia sp.]